MMLTRPNKPIDPYDLPRRVKVALVAIWLALLLGAIVNWLATVFLT